MDLPEFTKNSLALLRRILEQERGRFAREDLPFTSPAAFIYLHARNISELGNDVLALKKANRSRASRILVRPMLESLFSLVAAAKDSSFPARKIVAEQEDEIDRINKWIEEDHRIRAGKARYAGRAKLAAIPENGAAVVPATAVKQNGFWAKTESAACLRRVTAGGGHESVWYLPRRTRLRIFTPQDAT